MNSYLFKVPVSRKSQDNCSSKFRKVLVPLRAQKWPPTAEKKEKNIYLPGLHKPNGGGGGGGKYISLV